MAERKTYGAYGNIVFGPRGEALEFEGAEVEAYSEKQARFLFAKELSQGRLKGTSSIAILKLLKKHRVRFKEKK